MKRIGILIIVFLLPLAATAQQEEEDDFSDFVKEQSEDFNKFLDDANKEFIDFMRNPWKEFEAEKPVEKRTKPEPVEPVIYDEKTAPKNEKPTQLSIDQILDMTTTEGKQKPTIKIKDVDKITFEKPTVITKKKKEPTVIVVKEKTIDKQSTQNPHKENPVVVQQPREDFAPEKPAEETPLVNPATIKRNAPFFATEAKRTKFVYGGMTYYLNNALNRKCQLSSLNENSIANAYEALCTSDYKALLKDLISIKEEVLFNDWALFMLVKQVAETYCSTYNESIVMRQFLLNEMGYKVRMARKANENKMVLYVATDCQIYSSIFIMQNGQKYYDLDNKRPYAFYMCEKDSPKAKNSVSMHWKTTPILEGERVTSTHQSSNNSCQTTVSIPKALIEFYKTYPQCDYSVYTKAQVDTTVEDAILSSLAPLVANKNEKEAANILLNFVQTAFQYATDDEQFGYEKPFFVEELFYYPYSDCEDRSVLYAYLIKRLLKLDVVYLDYPNHIATAVRFNEDVNGDYLMVNGQRYTVCDPTYVGATIGMTMPMFKTVTANVLKY